MSQLWLPGEYSKSRVRLESECACVCVCVNNSKLDDERGSRAITGQCCMPSLSVNMCLVLCEKFCRVGLYTALFYAIIPMEVC